jgi:hypothetical protein
MDEPELLDTRLDRVPASAAAPDLDVTRELEILRLSGLVCAWVVQDHEPHEAETLDAMEVDSVFVDLIFVGEAELDDSTAWTR